VANRVFTPRAGARRAVVWANILTRLGSISIASGKTTGSLSGLGVSVGESMTLVRTRGYASLHFDPTGTADWVQVGLGLGIFTTDAFTVGQTAMPGPLSDADWDWVDHRVINFLPSISAAEGENAIALFRSFDIDTKAMRKMKTAQTLGWIAEVIVLSGSGSADISVGARHLFKLN